MNKIEDAALALSMWWAEKSFRTPLNKDNGDSNPLLFLLATMSTKNAQESVTEEKIKVFESALSKHIIEYREQYPYSNVRIHTDYNPDHYLSLAAEKAGLDDSAFPWKTSTYINEKNEVFVAFGYGKPYEKLEF